MNHTDFSIIPKSDELDFRAMGNLILNRSISLSIAVNNELLSPISQWLDDPGVTFQSRRYLWLQDPCHGASPYFPCNVFRSERAPIGVRSGTFKANAVR